MQNKCQSVKIKRVADTSRFNKRIGSTLYTVNVYFSEEATESFDDKVLRLAKNELNFSPLGTTPMYGFRVDPDNKDIRLVDEEAAGGAAYVSDDAWGYRAVSNRANLHGRKGTATIVLYVPRRYCQIPR